jgi:hypothetical protein
MSFATINVLTVAKTSETKRYQGLRLGIEKSYFLPTTIFSTDRYSAKRKVPFSSKSDGVSNDLREKGKSVAAGRFPTFLETPVLRYSETSSKTT